ncbi:MAG TPA: FAD-dependent monooxygenase [Steroidobacteraceae bacterium]|jgi:2-polyprenyl-6-methoxyphenol hydroxylase-like FAD-dependent oxidoreductase|nr:FAD-dependent monooxygenase [Steroidobacteraceae bacterium]
MISPPTALICGAGPVGLATALGLARAGISVVVIDSEPTIRDEPRACVYHSPVVERFDRLGLLDDLKEVGVLKQAYHYWTRDHTLLGHFSFDVLRPEDTAYPFNLHLGQPMLAAIILRHLLRVPGVEVRWRTRLTGISQDADGVTATLDTHNGEQQLRTQWLIGADGTHSGVRRALNLKLEGVTWPEWFVATNLRFDFEAHGFGQSNVVLDPGHWAIIPKIDRTGLWRCTYREDGALSEDEVRRRLPDRYALFAPGMRDCTPEAVSPYRVHDRCIDTFRVGRVLLAGDAAHVVNPIGGLGLTGGLLDAIPLSDALTAVIHGRRNESVLDAWATERRRVFLEVTAPTAKENRRRVSEANPEKRRADAARLHSLTNDPALARQALLGVFQLIGRDPLA